MTDRIVVAQADQPNEPTAEQHAPDGDQEAPAQDHGAEAAPAESPTTETPTTETPTTEAHAPEAEPLTADTHTAETHAADDHGADAHAKEGWLSTEILLVLALLVLFAIVFRTAKRAILTGLDNRAATIKDELDEAQRLREEAQAALAGFQRRQRDAAAEADEIVGHARAEAERMRSKAVAELELSLERRERQALDRIDQARQAAEREVRTIAVDVAVKAAREIITSQLGEDKASAERLLNDAIGDLPQRLH